MGGLVIWLQCACFVYLLSLSVGRQSVSVSATVTAVSERSVSAVVSVTAITGLQIRRHFRLRPKPEKVVSVGLYLRPPSASADAKIISFGRFWHTSVEFSRPTKPRRDVTLFCVVSRKIKVYAQQSAINKFY